ncbi:MAG: D-tyrosyl-tRNA(Tyr) deacylase [Bacilli bacterium]|nr:D-tyrosyl-tRNA(Tyr) deacylase [Bacilli bacterium]
MRVIVQRSKNSKVTIDGKVNGQIDSGFVLLVGFTEGDNEKIIDKMINKIINLRIFEDENEKMNKSILDVGGSILSISQFTLYANCSEGRRPSFVEALNPTEATKLYDLFNKKLSEFIHVETGIFGADMKVEIYNDGPVTVMLDSKEIFKNI